LLNLFAFGTYDDYKNAKKGVYPELVDSQLFKLKQLSFISICASSNKRNSWPLDDIVKRLDLLNIDAAEELIVAIIYAGLLSGQIDQRTNTFEVTWVAARDLKSTELSVLSESLGKWAGDIKSALSMVESQIADLTKALKDANDEKLVLETEKQLRINHHQHHHHHHNHHQQQYQHHGGSGGGAGGGGGGGQTNDYELQKVLMEQMQMMETDEGTYAEEKGRGGAGGGEGESSVISSNPLEGEPKRRKGELQMSRSRTDG
jgi:hypothetical protein